jgi:CheY-like chemotaxis protein/HPt (histidine-containing phosphotransfer) domain-containing protein
LFESFEQAETSTTRRFGGTGLGLTICRNLLDAMGGEIGVLSTPGTGSCFAFNVPFKRSRATLEVTPAREVPRPRSADALAGANVLLAEDNPINQQLALELLRRAGAVVDVAENGRIALERVQQKDYDVVLMDIHMPEMDGLEATRAIRDLGYTVPIVAVSADALEERQSHALESGCDDYVTKPIDFDRLLGSVQRLLTKDRPMTPRQRRASDPEPAIDERSILLSQRTPGINVGLAIRNHNGNVKLMLKLMGDFGEYYGDAGHRMREAVSTGQLEDAERLAHNLHGVAGSFGAGHLKEASKSLEHALIARDEPKLLGLINSFEIALTEVLESTQSLAGNEVSFRASDFEESR